MSLAGVTNDSVQYYVKEGQKIYMSCTDKLGSLREVRNTARTECGGRAPDIEAFISKICRDDVDSLAQAITDGNVEQFQGYLDLGVSPPAHLSDNEENSLLEAAIAKGHAQIAQILLPYSSNRNLIDSLKVLLLMAGKEPAWNRFVPMARSLALRLKAWEVTEKQIAKWLDRKPEELDAEALSCAKGFHQATLSHLKARKALDESKADAKSKEFRNCNPSGTVTNLAYAVRERHDVLLALYQQSGVRLTETTVVDTLSPLDIAVVKEDAEIFQLLLPYSDEGIAVDALVLIMEKVIASVDWHKWVPWGRQVIDHMADLKSAYEEFTKLITRKFNDTKKPLSDNARARAIAFRDEVFAYFQSPIPSGRTSTADHAPINTAGATHAQSEPPASASAAHSDLTRLAKFAYVESVGFRLQQAS